MMYGKKLCLAFVISCAALAPVWAQEDAAPAEADAADADVSSAESAASQDVPVVAEEAAAEEPEEAPVSRVAAIPFYREEILTGVWDSVRELIDPEYTVKPGDKVRIRFEHPEVPVFDGEYTVSDAGSLDDIPQDQAGGPINLNGVRYRDLRDKVLSAFRTKRRVLLTDEAFASGARFDVDLAIAKGMAVTFTGEIGRPGKLSFAATQVDLVAALKQADIQSRLAFASLRRIRISCPGSGVAVFDLYRDDPNDERFRLRDGCGVEVPQQERVVTLTGLVRRPGKYELIANESWSILRDGFSGGFLPGADTRSINLFRHPVGGTQQSLFFDGSTDQALEHADSIAVHEYLDDWRKDVVSIAGGGVIQPVSSPLKSDMTLGDLVAQAGGFASDADTGMALIRTNKDRTSTRFNLHRERSLNMSLEPLDRVQTYSSFERRGGAKQAVLEGYVNTPGAAYPLSDNTRLWDVLADDGAILDPDKREQMFAAYLVRTDSASAVADARRIPLDALFASPADTALNARLESRDRIIVLKRETFDTGTRTVYVFGAVNKPGKVDVPREAGFDYVINEAGGLTPARYPLTVSRFKLFPTDTTAVTETRASKAGSGAVVSTPEELAAVGNINDRELFVISEARFVKDARAVKVAGEVQRPGAYPLLVDNEDLGSVLARAGVLTTAHVDGIELLRGKTRIIITNAPERSAMALADGDSIRVPQADRTVRITGAIVSSEDMVAFAWLPGKSASYYAERAGGFADSADFAAVRILLPSGAWERARRGGILGLLGIYEWRQVPAGSKIVVPVRKPKENAPRKTP